MSSRTAPLQPTPKLQLWTISLGSAVGQKVPGTARMCTVRFKGHFGWCSDTQSKDPKDRQAWHTSTSCVSATQATCAPKTNSLSVRSDFQHWSNLLSTMWKYFDLQDSSKTQSRFVLEIRIRNEPERKYRFRVYFTKSNY